MPRQFLIPAGAMLIFLPCLLACKAVSSLGKPTSTATPNPLRSTLFPSAPSAINPEATSPAATSPVPVIAPESGRRSCQQSAFSEDMYGVVVTPVRLHHRPYIPKNPKSNWAGSLRQGEIVHVLEIYCKKGVWLKVQRQSGSIGWAKEWGLSKDLVETTYIVPELNPTPTPMPP